MLCLLPVWAAAKPAASLEITATWSDDRTRLGLSWPDVRGRVELFRRELGGGEWQAHHPAVLTTHRLLDDIAPGRAWEYQVLIHGRDRIHAGYWTAGQGVPARADQGRALLVIDDSLADELAPELARFQADLTGAGYRVTRHLAPRGVADGRENLTRAFELRAWIAAQMQGDPFAPWTVVLVGHVPVVRSGMVNPDGHGARAMPTDLFYADPVGMWRPAQGPDGVVQLAPSVLPADRIAAQIGRIDFANLTADYGDEVPLLRAYFDRNHAWRHGRMGDLRHAYAGGRGHLVVERNALRNIVGPDAIRTGTHHDTAQDGPFLWGIDFGSPRAAAYRDNSPTPVFALNFGSYKQIFDARDNTMTVMLSRPGPLAVGWGGRPSWQLHGMAMGETIGQAHLRTVNNGRASQRASETRDYLTTGNYDWVGSIWVNLLGDPTLRAFPGQPVTDARATATGDGMRLNWTAPPGAQVLAFRADGPDAAWQPLADGQPVADGFIDPAPPAGATYLLRARDLVQVPAGSFYRLSQGVFAGLD